MEFLRGKTPMGTEASYYTPNKEIALARILGGFVIGITLLAVPFGLRSLRKDPVV